MIPSFAQKWRPILTATWFVAALFAVGALLRIVYVFQAPLYSTDHLRNLGYGIGFWTWGFQVYGLTPFDFSPLDSQYLWSNHHYTYPVMTLFFFAGIAKVWASIFFGKLVLTLLDALSTWLIYQTTNDRWTALLFWLNPISLWFSAREGQFEGYVIFFMVLSCYGLKKQKPWAFGALSLAIQTKLFPVFLGAYFLAKMDWKRPARLAGQFAWGIVGFAPSLLAQWQSRYLDHLFGAGYVPQYSPLTWNLGDAANFPYTPYWLVLAHWVVGVVFVLAGLYGVKKTGKFWEFFPAVVFVIFVKSNVLAQFWYLMLVPAFCLTISDTKWRRGMMFLAALLGVKSIYTILFGAIGYQNPPEVMYILQSCFLGV